MPGGTLQTLSAQLLPGSGELGSHHRVPDPGGDQAALCDREVVRWGDPVARARSAGAEGLLDPLRDGTGPRPQLRQGTVVVDARGRRRDVGIELGVGAAVAGALSAIEPTAAVPNSVRIRPGSMQTTSTPNPRTSNRSASEIATTAYLVAW